MRKKSQFFNAHSHSKYSVLDGMPTVEDMVSTVVANGQPALGLMDHGVMSGSLELYKACKKAGIAAFPGSEFYLVRSMEDRDERYHLGMLALTLEGYRTLVKLSSRSHLRERFYKKPLIDLADLSDLGATGLSGDLALTTGCYFGIVSQALVAGDEGKALDYLKLFRDNFPNCYVELQSHNIPPGTNELDEDEILDWLEGAASRLGLPTIITQDAHYCVESDKKTHNTMKQIGYFTSNSADDGAEKEWQFPGDPYHLAETQWVRDHFDADTWERAQDSYGDLLSKHRLKLPALDAYQYHMPQVVKRPMTDVVVRTNQRMRELGLDKKPKYVNRMMSELDVIEQQGFADYFAMVAKMCRFARSKGILVETRGSAAGCLVNWMLGISQLDPVKWDLDFTRFLSLDRTYPPDIDLDVDKFRRPELVSWLERHSNVTPIGTYGTLGEDAYGKGSIFVMFMQRERHRLGNEEFKRQYGGAKGIDDLAPKVARQLRKLSAMRVYKGRGTHAAGLVCTPDDYPLDLYVPTMLIASSNNTVTQVVMELVEEAGYVKVDLLGQRVLATIRRTYDHIGWRTDGLDIYGQIPLNDRAVFRLMRQGCADTGIFTFEGYTQALGCRDIGAKSVEDLALVNALYRPATRNAGFDKEYINRRLNPGSVRYIHDVFEEAFRKTYGVPVYQDQILALLRLLGMPEAELNQMLKAIKASNKKVEGAQETFTAIEEQFKELCRDTGVPNNRLNEAWEMIQQFSDYSFNRSHAVSYAVRGYVMAWLKVNYPLEFHAALLETISMAEDDDKEKLYVREARTRGIRLLAADINVSGAHWTIDRQRSAVRRGLSSIKGIGESAAMAVESGRPFTDVPDLIARTDSRSITGGKDFLRDGTWKGKLEILRDAGALESLGVKKPRGT